ncbi:MAG TPA: vWA domain-containing protein [Rhodopila sp.]
MMYRRTLLKSSALALAMPTLLRAAAPQRPLLMPGKQTLFQRVVARPGAIAYDASGGAGTGRPVPGFATFYVYARQDRDGAEFVQLGQATDGATIGWVASAELVDWPHAMIGAFTNPIHRQPVLFLDSRDHERTLITSTDPAAAAAQLRQGATSGQPGQVVAIEPANYVDITRQFYLLPILGAEPIETDSGPTVHLLEVISASADPPRAPLPSEADALQRFRAGLIFLIDTTVSMQLYIDATHSAVRSIITQIGASPVRDHFRFGVIGYRDSLLDTPRLEYTTRVFAEPDFARSADAAIVALGSVREAQASSAEFDEDPIAGLKTAIEATDWGSLGGRYIILITDAGAREASDPHSATHLGIAEIKQLARERGVAVFALHLLTPEGNTAHDHARAAAQYRTLTAMDGTTPLYFPVPSGDQAAFGRTITSLTDALLQQVARTTGQPLAPPAAVAPAAMEHQVEIVAEAMRLAYLGRTEQTRAPDIIRAYTADRDMGDLTRRAIGVRVLLTRDQLSDLAQSLRRVLDAGMASRVDPTTFFTQLRTAFAAAARGVSQNAPIAKLGSLLGEYLDGLPYQSDIMNISQDDWVAMGGIQQTEVLNGIEAKLRLYTEFQTQTDLWVNLAGPEHPGEAAYPVPLEALP